MGTILAATIEEVAVAAKPFLNRNLWVGADGLSCNARRRTGWKNDSGHCATNV
jgi:hypothetical protein